MSDGSWWIVEVRWSKQDLLTNITCLLHVNVLYSEKISPGLNLHIFKLYLLCYLSTFIMKTVDGQKQILTLIWRDVITLQFLNTIRLSCDYRTLPSNKTLNVRTLVAVIGGDHRNLASPSDSRFLHIYFYKFLIFAKNVYREIPLKFVSNFQSHSLLYFPPSFLIQVLW